MVGIAGTELRAEVRRFIAEELRAGSFEPRCDAWLSGHSPEFSRKLGERGWLGLTWPRQYGGQERTAMERFAVVEELLAAGAPVAAHWIGDRQTGPLLLRYGTEEQRQRFLPAIARGACFFAIGMSEPDSGSDLASVRTAARQTEGGWLVTGTKVWTSHAQRSHFMIALCRTAPPDGDRHQGLSQLLVDLAAPGVEIRPIRILTGEPHFAEVLLRDVHVPDAMVVGGLGEGWRQVTSELAYERSGPERYMSTFPLLLELVRAFTAEPSRAAAEVIGSLLGRLHALRQLSLEVAAALQAGEVPAVEAALVKDLGTRFETEVVEAARRLLPPPDRSAALRRRLREAVLHGPGFTLRGGTNEILRGIVARQLVGR